MSWFGEQLSSFTGKLTEIKDVLTDSGPGEGSLEQDDLSPKHLRDICKEKDAQIQMLLEEKEALEKSIEELDSQHQESINELLHLKNEAVKENSNMLKELSLQSQKFLEKSIFFQFEQNFHVPVSSGSKEFLSKDSISSSIKNINFINILGVLWKNFSVDTLNTVIDWLANQKEISANGSLSDPLLLERMTLYIKFLRQMALDPETFSPFVNEIAAVIYHLLSSNFSTSLETNSQLDEKTALKDATVDVGDFCSQTSTIDPSMYLCLFSPGPEPLICDNTSSVSEKSNVLDIEKLKNQISNLELEKTGLLKRISDLQEKTISSTTEDNFDDFTLQLSELQAQISILENENSDLNEMISNLKTSSSTTSTQTEDSLLVNPQIFELQMQIEVLEQEKSDLKATVVELEEKWNHSSLLLDLTASQCPDSSKCGMSDSNVSVLIQTDEYKCGCNSYELEAMMCILEQDKADLEEELSVYRNKQVSSTEIQTNEACFDFSQKSSSYSFVQPDECKCNCNAYELEAMLLIVEQEKADLMEELSTYRDKQLASVEIQTEDICIDLSQASKSSDLIQSGEHKCDCNSYEHEAMMCIVQQERAELEEELGMYRNRQLSSVETQTDETCSSMPQKSLSSIVANDHRCDCNAYELEALNCILEQDKADLEEELSSYKNRQLTSNETQTSEVCSEMIEKSSSSMFLQTNESKSNCNANELNNEGMSQQEKADFVKERLLGINRPVASNEIQTGEFKCDCNAFELEATISVLEQEKADLIEELSLHRNKKFVSSAIQTDEHKCDCNAFELEAMISILEQEKADLMEELSLHRNKKLDSSAIQTDEYKCDCNIYELEAMIGILEQEKSDLMEELSVHQNRQLESSEIQTDEFTCDCGASELLRSLSILEQEKTDLEEELSIYINRQLSSIEIQTDETCTTFSTLNYEREALRNRLSELERTFRDKQMEMLDEISLLREEINYRESCIDEKENIINSLTIELHECQTQIRELTETQSAVVSVDVQTVENSQTFETYQSQMLELRNSMEDRENIFSVLQNEMNLAIDELKKEIESKDCVLTENEGLILCLRKDVESYEKCIKDLTEKSSHAQDSAVQTDEVECSYETYKVQISELKAHLEIMEREVNDAQNQSLSLKKGIEKKNDLISLKDNELQSLRKQLEDRLKDIENLKMEFHKVNIHKASAKSLNDANQMTDDNIENEHFPESVSDLKKELMNKDTLATEKDEIIRSLNSYLEKYRTDISSLTQQLISLKSGSCKETCPCKKYESELADLKMFISEKDKIFKSTQTNLVSSVDSLKQAIKNKECLIKERDSMISTLKEELEVAKRNMKIHFNELALNPKLDYAKDIDTMAESDIKIMTQKCNQCSWTINGESHDIRNEIQSLQEKLKAIDLEKSQLLCILNEKSQECTSLRAEVHKLTNIVASEKQALFKLQEDNCLLRESAGNADPELSKEAVKKLSQIIRDKDFEIESLKQKNMTLTSLVQDGSSSPDHLQSLMEEKENLEKQIIVLKADRDKIMLRYNTVDKDCRQYAAEVKSLKAELSAEKEKFDVLEQKHFSVAQQYEEKQKSLINTQNEMITLKQRVTDLEEQQVDIKEKYSELLNRINSEEESMVQLSKEELTRQNSLLEELRSSNAEKDHLIQEKDCMILDLSQQAKSLKADYEQQLVSLSSFQAKVEELSNKLAEQEDNVQKLQDEKEALGLKLQDKSSEAGLLKEMNDQLSMSLKEREFTIQSMTEKISSLSQFISSDHSSSDKLDINQILADSESMFARAQSLLKERDETQLALNMSKQENQSLRNEIQRMKSSEIHLNKELERLRMHLIEIEDNYTQEAIKAEEREKELRDEIIELKHKAEISNTAVVDTSQRASQQIASLQEQLSMIASQRDQALAQVSSLEDQVQHQAASVSKMQLVLEQIQRGNEKKIKDTEKKFQVLVNKEKQRYRELEENLRQKEVQLEESSQALEAATRLSEQLDAKEQIISNLKSELAKTEDKIKMATQEIDSIRNNSEGKVDRLVMKSLVLGYFSTPPDQKSEVIRLLARVLDFNQEEMERAGIVVGRNAQKNEQRGILSSIFGRFHSISSERMQLGPEQSFTTLFVQFLENESQPIVPMKFPEEKMKPEVPLRQPSTSKKSPNEKKKLPLASPLLLDIDSSFPTFAPVPAIEYPKPSPSILREVLK